MPDDLRAWLTETLGHEPADLDIYARALTHGSAARGDYQRLEFLGDRVLGLAMADWLTGLYPHESEGKLSHRLNALVSGATCADVARELGVAPRLRLGKQAQDDGVTQSENVLGDATEALIGALFTERGFESASAFVRRAWGDRPSRAAEPPKHPKAELQEWASAAGFKPPVYTVRKVGGPDHAPRFEVEVEVPRHGIATGHGTSKGEAERDAARTLLEQAR